MSRKLLAIGLCLLSIAAAGCGGVEEKKIEKITPDQQSKLDAEHKATVEAIKAGQVPPTPGAGGAPAAGGHGAAAGGHGR